MAGLGKRALKALTWSGLIKAGVFMTTHCTVSLQGGVVSDPL